MKYFVLLIACMFIADVGHGQVNLVLNPSFEKYDTCPNYIDQLPYAKYWTTLDSAWHASDAIHNKGGVPEYCNICTSYSEISVPSSVYYNHYPHSGNGMIQLDFLFQQPDTYLGARDYAQGRLAKTLTAGKIYEGYFYVTSCQASSFVTNNIGAYLDDGTIDSTRHPGWTQYQYTPQVVDTNVINDTLNWVRISGAFTANGTEKFITIGNFRKSSSNTLIARGTIVGTMNNSLYLVDDVGVIDCDNIPFAGHDTLIRPGDSAFLGPHENLLPYTWYKLGITTALDSGGGIWVKPTVTTTYVLKQDLCKVVRWDTIKVRVWPDTVSHVGMNELALAKIQIYPNPSFDEVFIEGAKGHSVSVYDLLGRCGISPFIATEKEVLQIGDLVSGVYFVRITDVATGEAVTRRVVKE